MEKRDQLLSLLKKFLHSHYVCGRPRGKFSATGGVRPEYPLPPFHCTLIAVAFSSFVELIMRKGSLEGFEVGRDKIQITHIQYANDTLHFSKYDTSK